MFFILHCVLALVFVLLPFIIYGESVSYTVDFTGVEDHKALKSVRSISQLVALQKSPPPSIHALRYRAESDLPLLLKALHAHGYYEAIAHVTYEEGSPMRVAIHVSPGPLYTLESYTVAVEGIETETVLQELGIELLAPAYAHKILNAELKLMRLLADKGYPFAKIENRSVIVDGATKTVRVSLKAVPGPLCFFGGEVIQGTHTVQPAFIQKKTQWKKGDLYTTGPIESTQKNLLETGLFSSVLITHGAQKERQEDKEELPIHIEVAENKHRSIDIGLSYQTSYGPGVTYKWENRNISGLGRKLSFQGDFAKHSHSETASYLIPDFLRIGQDYLCQLQATEESILAYSTNGYSLINKIERKIHPRVRVSMGAKVESLHVGSSIADGEFFLVEFPFSVRWSTANHLLNPTKGNTLEYKIAPAFPKEGNADSYVMQELSHRAYYKPFSSSFITFAQKLTLQSVISKNLASIPIPKRLFGGSDEELRGYRYHSVSPLTPNNKPEGGKGALFYSLEARLQFTNRVGLVPFFDIGTVSSSSHIGSHPEWLKAVGIGLRYFSFVGPIRLDVGFPLDRRDLDPRYRIFIGIGQTF